MLSINTTASVTRWICVRIDGLGALFTAGLAAYLVYGGSNAPKASDTGFSLNMAVGFSSMILWWVRLLNEFEVSGMSFLVVYMCHVSHKIITYRQ